MSANLGDYAEDAVINFKFSTFEAAGASVDLTVDGTISVYKGDNVTQSTAGITFTEAFDSITGVHHIKIDLSSNAFYEVGEDYQVVVTGATIDGESVNVATRDFSIENRTAFPKADYPANFSALGIESDGDLSKVDSLDGHTPQTGDSFARLGAPSGASVSADLATAQTDLDTITGSDGVTLATTQGNYAPAVAGDEMNLADNAMTASKYDESTAFPLASADSGSTQVARMGADGDTLETLSDQIDLTASQAKLQRYASISLRSDTAELITDLSAEFSEINTDYGSGGGTYGSISSGLEAIYAASAQAVADIAGLSFPSATEIVDEWETQSQADPSGFHVHVREWNGVPLGTTNPLPNVAAGSIGGLPTDTDGNGRVRVVSGTSAGEISLSSGVAKAQLDGSVTHGGAGAGLFIGQGALFLNPSGDAVVMQSTFAGSSGLNLIPGSGGPALEFNNADADLVQSSNLPNNFSDLSVASGTGYVVIGGILGGALAESSPGRLAGNVSTFFDNDDAATSQTVDDVGSGGGGGGDATAANQSTIITHLTELKGSGFVESTDSNKAIRDRGDAAWTSGAAGTGSRNVIVTVKDDSANLIAGAEVTVRNSDNESLGIYGTTVVGGQVPFNLNDGDYKFAVTDRAGYQTHVPEDNTVDEDNEQIELTITAIGITSPSDPALCNVAVFVKQNGTPVENAVVRARIRDKNSAVDNSVLSLKEIRERTDASGLAVLPLIRQGQFTDGNGVYVIEVIDRRVESWKIEAAIPDTPTANLEDLISP